ncbi:MAG: UDP-N-acetylmuramoyl-tripeptide--D-alanyl-D-alanine ligase [Bacteroidales bacterium]|nr:UDP-N-acetylmuramoyl-tripeptide--D-alanyl-D-alanine ligase [Bacteroidales bacterium]
MKKSQFFGCDLDTMPRLYSAYLDNRQVVTESSKAVPGTMFFALKGSRFDGNDFVGEVLAQGCRAVVTSDPRWQDAPGCLWVVDTLRALQALAAWHRQRIGVPVIGITGSNGKTTTKELVCAVLRTAFRVHATAGNFNNHIGLPLTLLAMPEDTEIAVVEMGANHAGEIAELCRIAQPTHGIVTNVSATHIGEYGSMETIYQTKRALYASVAARRGVIFAWTGHPLVMKMASHLAVRKEFYGVGHPTMQQRGHRLACSAEVVSEEPYLTVGISDAAGNGVSCATHLIGAYNVANIAAATCVGLHFGLDLRQIAGGISAYVPANNRSQLLRTGRNLLWVDCYNANPTSMSLSVQSFLHRSEPDKLLILGDMGELGAQADAEHRKMLSDIPPQDGLEIWTAGGLFAAAAATVGRSDVRAFPTTDALQAYLRQNPPEGRFILLKGSHSMRLDRLVENL